MLVSCHSRARRVGHRMSFNINFLFFPLLICTYLFSACSGVPAQHGSVVSFGSLDIFFDFAALILNNNEETSAISFDKHDQTCF